MHLLPDWSDVVKRLSCGQQHDLHLVTTKSIESTAYDAQADLQPHFSSVEVHVIEIDPSGGWPYAPNVFFWCCAQFMAKNPGIPWQLVELDCLPLRSNSFDAIGSQYTNSGAPFFGSVGPTPWRDEVSGKIAPSRWGKEDVMMSGCAVYPGDLPARANFKGLMEDFMKGQESTDEAWDIHLRAAMRADGMAHTDLIVSHWNTGNYRIENGGIVCDAMGSHEIFEQHPEWEKRKCGGRLNPSATLVHGCKDTTLRDLILNDQIPDFVAPPKRTVGQGAKLPAAEPETPPALSDTVSKSEVVTMFKDFRKDLIADLKDIIRPIPAAPPQEPQSDAPGIWPLVKRKLEANKWRLSDLSKAVNLPVAELKTLLESKGYEAKPPGMWIKECRGALQTA